MSSSTSDSVITALELDDPDTFVKESTSGALIIGTRDTVFKIAPRGSPAQERILQQGAWLRRHNHRLVTLPVVFKMFDTGYVMPRYHRRTLNPTDGCIYIIDALTDIWSLQDEDVVFDRDGFVGYVKHVGGWLRHDAATKLANNLCEIASSWVWCSIHGDPTLDNLMVDVRGYHILTDPIPTHPFMPNVAVSDLGKVLQSVWGYESIIESGGAAPFPDRNVVYEHIVASFGDDVLYGARAFAVLHMLRLLPYQERKGNMFVVKTIKEIIQHEFDNLYL